MREFQRHEQPLRYESGTEACAESEEQHASTRVRAERLHRGVVDNLHRRAERLLVVETHPAATQIVRFMRRSAALDGSRVPDRHGVILPALDGLAHFGGHAARRHRLAGWDLQ